MQKVNHKIQMITNSKEFQVRPWKEESLQLKMYWDEVLVYTPLENTHTLSDPQPRAFFSMTPSFAGAALEPDLEVSTANIRDGNLSRFGVKILVLATF